MKHIVVDLEMNNVSGKFAVKKICGKETIEIGAVMLDEQLHEISSFRTYVKPEYNDVISPSITRLTGITTEMVSGAPHFAEAFRMFTSWCLGTGEDVTVYAWSESDLTQLRMEIAAKGCELTGGESILLDEKWQDFQAEFGVSMHFEHQVSLKMALEMAGIDFSGRQHDALDDARNTADLLAVFRDEELFDLMLRKIEEVMKPKSCGCCLGELLKLSGFVVA